MVPAPKRGLRLVLAATPGWVWPALGIVLLWIGIGLHLAHQRAQAIDAARSTGINLARAFRESTLRTIQEIDQTVLFVRALHARDGRAVDLRPWVEGAGPEMRLALQIATADRNGIVTLSNLRPVTERIDLSDRPHFRHFADQPPDAALRDHLHVSTPVLGRVSKAWTIQFVRMLKTPDGAFDGIVVLSVPPEHLTRFYDSVDIGAQGTITLLGLDRVIRARAGPDAAPIGTHSASPAPDIAQDQAEGSFEWVDPIDDTRRIESFARVPGYPLVVSVGLSRSEALAATSDTAAVLAGSGIFLTLLLSLLGLAIRAGQQELAESRAISAVAVENLGQGLIMVDAQGVIVLINGRAGELLALPPRFQPGSRFADMVAWQRAQGEFGPGTPERVRRLLQNTPRPDLALPQEYRRRRPNGTWLEVRTIGLPGGATLFSIRDVTAWEEAQAALVAARDAAEAAMRARAQFLAVMSHEIRTPLNGILGIAELLQECAREPEHVRFVSVIRQSGQHLLDLLNDILDFSKLEHAAIELESLPFDPAQTLRDAVALMEPRAEEQGLGLDCAIAPGIPARVLGDAHRLRQVLLNLVGNALKFTREGGVSVAMHALADGTDWHLHIAVRDTGIGIAAEMLPRLFQEFTQVDGSISRRFGGSGLGLVISRRLVEAMGGAIDAESSPGQGSEFRFWIRVAEAPADLAAAEQPEAAEDLLAARRPRVLLAEDNRVNRLVATRMAERLGARVEAVGDGRAALEAVRDGSFDLVLMDVMMPEMDGLAATRAIRALPGPKARTPVVGLSANAFRSDQAAAIAAGMDGFVTKPATLPQLAQAMARALADAAPEPAAPEGAAPEGAAATTAAPTSALAALAATLGADAAELIAAAFAEEAPAQMRRLLALAAAGDATALAREAHAIAGSAGTVGLDDLATALRQLERALRRGEPVDLPAVAAIATLVDAGLAALCPRDRQDGRAEPALPGAAPAKAA
jgi:signal transduction histidine kinase/DNA-binding response OmpR family regulator